MGDARVEQILRQIDKIHKLQDTIAELRVNRSGDNWINLVFVGVICFAVGAGSLALYLKLDGVL